MNVTTEQLAEILAGIARSQQAIIDAIESDNGGWKNNHLLNKLNVAANLRLTDARLIDIPSRVLLRQMSRVPMPPEQILKDLHTALGTSASSAPAGAAGTAGAGKAKPDDDLDFFSN